MRWRICVIGIILTHEANRSRTQEQNREDARQRLITLIQKATEIPKPRQKTKPTLESKARRLEGKRKRDEIKWLRRVPSGERERG